MKFAGCLSVEDGVGDDQCEDVFGGLKAAMSLSWRCVGTKVHFNVIQGYILFEGERAFLSQRLKHFKPILWACTTVTRFNKSKF